jgi:hypothetical protein
VPFISPALNYLKLVGVNVAPTYQLGAAMESATARSPSGVLAMSNSVEDGIIVEFDSDEIVVRKPGMVFLIAFKKPPDQRHLPHQRHLLVTRSGLPTSLRNH